ncbi:MAG: hypothetical protein OJF48_001377 [Afipia sp.]|nr:MAG: hypothetical protein OJF48_001377 [Afipia sp.]
MSLVRFVGTGRDDENANRLQELIKPGPDDKRSNEMAGAIRDANADFLSEP